jgi:hypothetical protein
MGGRCKGKGTVSLYVRTAQWRRIGSETSVAIGLREWRTSRSGSFTLGEKFPDTQRTGDWVGQRAILDVITKRRIFAPAVNRALIIQPIAKHFADCIAVCSSTGLR